MIRLFGILFLFTLRHLGYRGSFRLRRLCNACSEIESLVRLKLMIHFDGAAFSYRAVK